MQNVMDGHRVPYYWSRIGDDLENLLLFAYYYHAIPIRKQNKEPFSDSWYDSVSATPTGANKEAFSCLVRKSHTFQYIKSGGTT